MRRPAAALLGTVAGTVLLVGAKYGAASPAGSTSVASTDTGATDAAGNSANPANPSATDASAGSAGPAASGPAASGPAASGRAAPSPGQTTPAGRASGAPPAATTAPPACTSATGNPVNVAQPGVGAITVTIQVCGGVLKTATATQSRSNWDANQQAVPALNGLAVRYYKTDITKIHYSGATLTSNAYQASLRSAAGKAGI